MNLSFLNKVPEFSSRNFNYVSYICGILMGVSSIFFIYEMFTSDNFGIDIQWNIFKSAWFTPLFFIGLILAIINWGKFGHWGGQPYNVYKDRNGKEYVERNDDITDNMFAHFILPIIGHFVIEPILYACIIFYPLMCVFAIIGIILPYFLSILLLGISAAVFMGGRTLAKVRCHSLIVLLATVIIGGGLTWISINMENAKAGSSRTEITTDAPMDENTDNTDTFEATENPTQTTSDDMFDDAATSPVSSDSKSDADMFDNAEATPSSTHSGNDADMFENADVSPAPSNNDADMFK